MLSRVLALTLISAVIIQIAIGSLLERTDIKGLCDKMQSYHLAKVNKPAIFLLRASNVTGFVYIRKVSTDFFNVFTTLNESLKRYIYNSAAAFQSIRLKNVAYHETHLKTLVLRL